MKKNDSQATQLPTSPVDGAKYIGAIAKSLAVLALRMAPKRLKDKSDQVPFLDAIGLDRNEIAGLLGMTPESVTCAPCKGGAFQWVRIPPGNCSSRKQPEQSWR